jgi:photosystem II stability/assembly factor-like uncharacterized protein
MEPSMNRTLTLAGLMASALILAACGGGSDPAKPTLVFTTALAAGASCAGGGTTVSAGLDANSDGTLQSTEVTQMQTICNGVAGPVAGAVAAGPAASGAAGSAVARLVLTPEPNGTNCTSGGMRVSAGADANANGTLEAAEVTTTSYVCNTAASAWVNVTAPTQQAEANKAYSANAAQRVVISLPATAAVGDTVAVAGTGAGGWRLAQAASQSILSGAGHTVVATNQSWVDTPSGNGNWYAIAADETGQKLYAAQSTGPLKVSADGGQSWTTATTGDDSWRGLATSRSGQIAVAVAGSGAMVRTTDGGTSWAAVAASPLGYLERVAMSDDGQFILVARDGPASAVYLSSDGGATFNLVQGLPGGGNWYSVAMSADGRRMAATQNATLGSNAIIVSGDSGVTWSVVAAPKGLHNVAMSRDGGTLVGITFSGTDNSVYLSKENGTTWEFRLGVLASNGSHLKAAVSDDGKTIAVSAWNGSVNVSVDGGVEWSARGVVSIWEGVAVAGNGSRIVTGDTKNGVVSVGSTFLPSASVPGTTGYISGAQGTGVTLEYVGNNNWAIVNSTGTLYMPGI